MFAWLLWTLGWRLSCCDRIWHDILSLGAGCCHCGTRLVEPNEVPMQDEELPQKVLLSQYFSKIISLWVQFVSSQLLKELCRVVAWGCTTGVLVALATQHCNFMFPVSRSGKTSTDISTIATRSFAGSGPWLSDDKGCWFLLITLFKSLKCIWLICYAEIWAMKFADRLVFKVVKAMPQRLGLQILRCWSK